MTTGSLATVLRPFDALSQLFVDAAEQADCRREIEESCAEPRIGDCRFAASPFCAARLREAKKQADGEGGDSTVRGEKATADALWFPKRGRNVLRIGTREGPELIDTPIRVIVAGGTLQRQRKRLVVFHGDHYTGKSVAALEWAWEKKALWWAGQRFYWFSLEHPEATRLLTAPHVVLDGLDKDWLLASGVHQRNARYVVSTRHEANLITLITSNCRPDDLCKVIGRRFEFMQESDDVAFVFTGGFPLTFLPPPDGEEEDVGPQGMEGGEEIPF